MTAWVDRHGDVWRAGSDGLMHSLETAPFPREYVERKWGPLREASDLSDLAPPLTLGDTIRAISVSISASYPADLDHEAHVWRRCMKVTEETGEVFEALSGLLGENPRKGVTHSLEDVITELLDVAGSALGAVSFLTADQGKPLTLLEERLTYVLGRLQ